MGRPTMPQNNDSWGYLRDELEWGKAAYIENTASATTAIQDALVTPLGRTRFSPVRLPQRKTGFQKREVNTGVICFGIL
jgi:hypothetical protein